MIMYWLVLLLMAQCLGAQEIRKASQCFKSRGIPKVVFSCNSNEMIKISRAFHGITVEDRSLMDPSECTASPGSNGVNCTFCPGDCIDDSMNMVYDWLTCMGNTSCERTVMQSYMPACPGRDKFSDYLQVEYQCIPRSSVLDICSEAEEWMSEGYLMSPNYPYHYPTSRDCMCSLSTDSRSRLELNFYDLLLETKDGRCRADWLMLRQSGQKHRHCGAIMTGTKELTSSSSSIVLQFHSDENSNDTQSFQYFSRSLKGFWLHFKAEPTSSVNIKCQPLTKSDEEVKEISVDDQDYDEVVQMKDGDEDTQKETNSVDDDDMNKKKTGRKGGKMKPSPNEVDYQEGQSKSSASVVVTHSLLLLVMMTWWGLY